MIEVGPTAWNEILMRITAQLILTVILIASPTPLWAQLEAAAPAPGVFLVAKPEMPDRRFEHAVILLLTHDDRGTAGLVLTEPAGMARSDAGEPRHMVFNGGPVAPNRVQVLMRGEPPDSSFRRVWEDVWWSTDGDVIEALLEDEFDPDVLRVFVGYASWVPGQLDAELGAPDAWGLFRAEPDDVFVSDPEDLWERFMGRNRRLFASQGTRIEVNSPVVPDL